MPDPNVIAREKFACPACGADAHWNPAKQALVCPFCGTESPATLQKRGAETVIVEHDLVAALRGLPDARRGWQADKVSVKCQSCQAISVFDPSRVGQRCEFCGSSQLVPYEQVKEPFSPESLLPFAIQESKARDLLRAWYARQWLAVNSTITGTISSRPRYMSAVSTNVDRSLKPAKRADSRASSATMPF